MSSASRMPHDSGWVENAGKRGLSLQVSVGAIVNFQICPNNTVEVSIQKKGKEEFIVTKRRGEKPTIGIHRGGTGHTSASKSPFMSRKCALSPPPGFTAINNRERVKKISSTEFLPSSSEGTPSSIQIIPVLIHRLPSTDSYVRH